VKAAWQVLSSVADNSVVRSLGVEATSAAAAAAAAGVQSSDVTIQLRRIAMLCCVD